MLLWVGSEALVVARLHLLVLSANSLKLFTQLFNVLLLNRQVLRQVVVEAIHLFQLVLQASVAEVRLLRVVLGKALLRGLDLVKLLGAAVLVELEFGLLDLASQVVHISNQIHVQLHDVEVVFLLQGLLLVELSLQSLIGLAQILSLCLEFFLDVLVDIFLLPLRIGDIGVKTLVELQLQLVVVVNVLGHIIHCLAV